MAKTWLDFFLNGHLANVQRIPQLGERFRRFGARPKDDFDAMRMGCLIDYEQYQKGMRIPVVQAGIITWTAAQLAFLRIATDKSGPTMMPSRAVQPAAELVDALSNAKAPSRDLWRAALEEAAWYVDLPHKQLLLGERHEVRAIFSCPFEGEVWINAILTRPGDDRLFGRVCWRLAEERPDTEWKPVDSKVVAFGGVARFGDLPGPDDLLAQGDIPKMDAGYFRDSVEDLLGLVVLYETVQNDAERGQDFLPQSTREEARRATPLLRQTFSLFRVRKLEAPQDRFGRPPAPRLGGWCLEVRQKVEGHFKMQPFGPGRAFRKLIYVAGYERGPEDGRVQAELRPLG
jgi:hypothetical protein